MRQGVNFFTEFDPVRPLRVTKGALVTLPFFKIGWVERGVLDLPDLVEVDPEAPSLQVEHFAPPRRCSRVKSFSYFGSEEIGCAGDGSSQLFYRLIKLRCVPGCPRDLPV